MKTFEKLFIAFILLFFAFNIARCQSYALISIDSIADYWYNEDTLSVMWAIKITDSDGTWVADWKNTRENAEFRAQEIRNIYKIDFLNVEEIMKNISFTYEDIWDEYPEYKVFYKDIIIGYFYIDSGIYNFYPLE